MRLVAILMLLAIFSGPIIAREPLAPEKVARFVAAAESVADGVAPQAVSARTHLVALPDHARAIVAAHGFSESRWRTVAQRVLAAHEAEHMAGGSPNTAETARKLSADPTLSAAERRGILEVVRATQADMAAFAAETEDDRKVIAPFMGRLDDLVGL